MHELITQVKGKILTLDAGFVDRELVEKIAKQFMMPYVFPKKNWSAPLKVDKQLSF